MAQKREAEAKQKELEVEKEKPFARTRYTQKGSSIVDCLKFVLITALTYYFILECRVFNLHKYSFVFEGFFFILSSLSLILHLLISFRDDPELDKSLKERIRWGDPMAHLVKVM